MTVYQYMAISCYYGNSITITNSCPPGLCSETTQLEVFLCVQGIDVICNETLQESYLHLGICMTYNESSSDEQESDAISFGGFPYVYYSNTVKHRHIASSTT